MAAPQDTLNLWFTSDQEYKYLMQGVATNNATLMLMAIDADKRTLSPAWEELIYTLENQKAKRKKEDKFLRDIFQETSRVFLKKEAEVSTLNQTLSTGTYNCVSGTALFGQLLSHFGYDFRVMETESHVFIEMEVDGKPIIFESTHPAQGLIIGEKRVRAFKALFNPPGTEGRPAKEAFNPIVSSSGATASGMTISSIHLKQLAGLQYYNDALLHLKQENYLKAKAQIEKAFLLYPSERIQDFQTMMQDWLKEASSHQ